MGNASALAGLLLLFGAVSASPTGAETVIVDGAYAKLSPGNAKIARALFEAQVTNTIPMTKAAAPTPTTAAAPKALTVDQIAAMKQNGRGWGQIFQTMKAQGLLTDKNLGQVVSRYQHQHERTSTDVVTTAATKER